MEKYLLVHGYGIGINSFLQKPKKEDGGFKAFSSLVSKGEAVVFRWDEKQELSRIETLSPFSYLDLYRSEKKKSFKASLLGKLDTIVNQVQPSIIVGHSMGAQLIKNYLDLYKPIQSLKLIIWSQADIESSVIVSSRIPIHNYYCQWDQSLWTSSFLNLKMRAGLIGASSTSIINYFWPLNKTYNPHTSAICDPLWLKNIRKRSQLV